MDDPEQAKQALARQLEKLIKVEGADEGDRKHRTSNFEQRTSNKPR
jgi:hypothetical protein